MFPQGLSQPIGDLALIATKIVSSDTRINSLKGFYSGRLDSERLICNQMVWPFLTPRDFAALGYPPGR